MENKAMRFGTLTVAAVTILVVASFAGCISTEKKTNPSVLTVTGSTTVLPIAQKASEIYMDKHKNADVRITGGGSSVGVSGVGQGTANIGMSSRDLTSTEKTQYPDLVRYVIAKDGIVLIVHKDNNLTSLTLTQIRGIYNGTYTNWKQLGGKDLTIVVIGRDSASGTRTYFQDTVMNKENFTAGQLEKSSNGAIEESVGSTPGAIGYVGLGFAGTSVKALKIDTGTEKIEATVATVLSLKYPISRELYMFTKGPATGLAKDYIDFILSTEGQKLVSDEGFVPLS